MNTTQRTLDLIIRPKLRLAEVERLIRATRIIVPPLSRRKLVAMCEEGIFDYAPRRTIRAPFLIYEDSFLRWARELDE